MNDNDVSDALTTALRSAPELNSAPGLALGVAQDATVNGSDPNQGGQAVAQTINANAQQQAVQNAAKAHGGAGLLSKTLGWANDRTGGLLGKVAGGIATAAHDINSATGGAAGAAINEMSAPLREVQHQYRYIHDVEATHGPLAATLAAIPAILGGVVGGYATGSAQGVELGAEGGEWLGSHLIYRDSYDRTSSGAAYRDPNTGQPVSMGRDIAGAVGLKPGSKAFTLTSGLTDAVGDLALDPVGDVGKLVGQTQSAEGLGGVLGNRFGGMAPQGASLVQKAEDVDRIYNQYGNFRRAVRQIAGMTPGEISTNYPKIVGIVGERTAGQEALLSRLGVASTPDDVVNVLRNAVKAQEMVSDVMPSMTLTRVPFHAASQAIQNYEGPGSGVIKSVTSYLPTNFDPSALELSNREIDPSDDFGINAVYRVARFTQSKATAEAVASDYANTTDVGKRILIYRNLMKNTLIGMGHAEDSPYVDHELQQMLGGSAPGHDAMYGMGVDGNNVSKLAATTDDPEVAAGILASQTGKLALPNFNDLILDSRKLVAYKSLYGRADDFLYRNFTQGVFKKLALLSGGFAQRIAAAEAIPAAAREGVWNLVKSAVGANAARFGYDAVGDDELGHIAATVQHLKDGLGRVAGVADGVVNSDETTQRLADLVQANNGHIVPAAVSTETHYSGEVGGPAVKAERDVKALVGSVPPKKMFGDRFGAFGPGDQNFGNYWQSALAETARDPASQKAAEAYLEAMRAGSSAEEATQAASQAGADYWRSQPARVLSNYARSVRPSVAGAEPIDDWGRVIAENMRGVTHSGQITDAAGNVIREAIPNVELVNNVATGTLTPMATLDSIDESARPLAVKGREMIDIPHGNLLDRVANFGFSRVLDPIINKLSREPIYANEYLRQFDHLAPLVDSGEMGKAEAIQLAQVRAVHGVVPFIHNTMERSQFAELARNFMPFYFAQEQAFRRFGRVLADDPGAFRQLQMMTSALTDVGHQQTDGQGKQWLLFPGAGFLDNAVVGTLGNLGIPVAGSVPVSFSGQVRSLSTILPAADASPKMGPLVAIAGHLLENFDPAARPLVTSAIGGVANSGSIWDQLIPNSTLKRTVQAFWGEHGRSFQSSMIQTIQSLQYQQNQAMDKWTAAGHSPDDPGAPKIVPSALDTQDWQDFINRVKNQTRINFLMKAAIGAVTPASPDMTLGDAGLRQEVQDEISKAGSVSGGIQAFLAKNPNATPYTVFQSDAPNGGTVPEASKPAEDFINQNLDTIKKYGYGGAWLIPQVQGAKFDATVYNEQLAQGLREKKTPEQFQKDLYIAAANNQFYGVDLPAHRAALAKASGSQAAVDAVQRLAQDPQDHQAAVALNQALRDAGSNDATIAENQNFTAYLNAFGKQNPTWWDDFTSSTRTHERELAVTQLQQMQKNGDLIGPQAPGIAHLLGDYANYQQSLLAGQQDGWVQTTRTELKADWQSYIDGFSAAHPEYAAVARKVFRDL